MLRPQAGDKSPPAERSLREGSTERTSGVARGIAADGTVASGAATAAAYAVLAAGRAGAAAEFRAAWDSIIEE